MSNLQLTFLALSALVAAGVVFWSFMNQNREIVMPIQIGGDENQLHALIEGTIGATGESLFYALARELAHYLSIDSVFIASCDESAAECYRTHAYWCDDGYVMNQGVSLAHCPAGSTGGFWSLENSASDMFPQSDLFHDRFRVFGFFSVPLLDSSGNKIGLMAGMHRQSFRPDNHQIDIIKLFSVRAAAEMERSLAIKETLLEKDRAQITLHSIGDGVITTDKSGAIDYMNPIAEHLSGWLFHQVMGMSMESILHLEDEATGNIIPDPARRCLSERRIISPKTENVLVSRNGTRYSIQGTAAPMFGAQGDCLGVVLVFKDVTDSRRHQKMIVHQATHDSLTGLVNRAEFEVRLQKSLESAQLFSNAHALLYLDLDQFKVVNDSAGHVAGDELLKQISALLSSQLRRRDTLGRLGGDEFSVLLENCPLSKASRVAEILIDSIRDYRFTWEDKTYKLGVSIGIVAITSESEEIMDIMKKADHACYAAKDLGRGCAYVVTDHVSIPNVPPAEKLNREDIACAIEKGRFQLCYQPVIELNTETQGAFARAEVLLRMIDPEDNEVMPGAFIPSAGRYGMMAQIDRWVISRLFNHYAHIFMQNPDLIMSVNLSAQAITDDMIIEFVLDQFHKNALSPKQICFEIAETTLTNHFTHTSGFIGEMRQIGCSIALDDFGNGLSSFSYLKNTKVDFVKIDGCLIRDVSMDIIDKAMVDSINTMCHLLGIRTIAKNTDSDLVVQTVKQLGIDYAQGYFLGNPASMDEFTHLKSEGVSRPRAMIN